MVDGNDYVITLYTLRRAIEALLQSVTAHRKKGLRRLFLRSYTLPSDCSKRLLDYLHGRLNRSKVTYPHFVTYHGFWTNAR